MFQAWRGRGGREAPTAGWRVECVFGEALLGGSGAVEQARGLRGLGWLKRPRRGAQVIRRGARVRAGCQGPREQGKRPRPADLHVAGIQARGALELARGSAVVAVFLVERAALEEALGAGGGAAAARGREAGQGGGGSVGSRRRGRRAGGAALPQQNGAASPRLPAIEQQERHGRSARTTALSALPEGRAGQGRARAPAPAPMPTRAHLRASPSVASSSSAALARSDSAPSASPRALRAWPRRFHESGNLRGAGFGGRVA